MPYCNIKTNVKVEKKKELSKELTKVIELIPGKTENWIMTSIDDEAVMSFAGTDDPCALRTESMLTMNQSRTGAGTEQISKATPHNSARADFEKNWVLMKAVFRRNTLCIARKSDKVTKSERNFSERCRRRIVRCCPKIETLYNHKPR